MVKNIIFIAFLVLSLAVFVTYFLFQKSKPAAGPETSPKEETITEKQLKELGELRNKAGIQSLTDSKTRPRWARLAQ